MNRIITVKGIGRISAKPDYAVLSMTLESKHEDYDKAMETASGNIQSLNDALYGAGFEKGAVKTAKFDVRTDYKQVKDCDGNYHSVFCGYEVTHDLKLSFDFDMGRLSRALSAIAECPSHPQLSIAFTVKDAAAINEEILRSAAINAKRKAEILCEASGVEIGDLIEINYNWDELNIYSPTRLECCKNSKSLMAFNSPIDIDPDNIDVSDTATFVWEIRQKPLA